MRTARLTFACLGVTLLLLSARASSARAAPATLPSCASTSTPKAWKEPAKRLLSAVLAHRDDKAPRERTRRKLWRLLRRHAKDAPSKTSLRSVALLDVAPRGTVYVALWLRVAKRRAVAIVELRAKKGCWRTARRVELVVSTCTPDRVPRCIDGNLSKIPLRSFRRRSAYSGATRLLSKRVQRSKKQRNYRLGLLTLKDVRQQGKSFRVRVRSTVAICGNLVCRPIGEPSWLSPVDLLSRGKRWTLTEL